MTECADIRKNRGELASGQQRRASNPLKSVWVEASAGTGKTKVLSDRVLRLLLNNVNPAKILCLTYTKAAAVEMNDRIAFIICLEVYQNRPKNMPCWKQKRVSFLPCCLIRLEE